MWVPQSDQDPGHPGDEMSSNTVCVPRSDMGIGTIFSLNLKPEGGKRKESWKVVKFTAVALNV